ncbi:MAG: S41 family peptidase [Clostridia bacterium]|nr:S41 family peptidase [Clostridia bacterium]
MQSVSRRVCTVIIAILTAAILVGLTVMVTTAVLDGNGMSAGLAQSKGTNGDYGSRYQRLDEVYNILMDEYYVDVDSDSLIQAAIDGMMSSLDDPYTFYITPDEMSSLNSSRSGNYVGIGVQVVRTDDSYIRVTRVFTNSSAMEAGIQKDDIIFAADGIELRPQSDTELTECVAKIKDGEIGTYTNITVLRGEEKLEMLVERTAVTQDRVEYSILEGDVGYILLYDFFGSAIDGVDNALDYFAQNDVKAIIFDVRDNPGGLLDYCVDITDRFVDAGVIVYTKDRYGYRVDYEAEDGKVGLPMVVLINEGSASASEIFSAALQEAGAATVVGTTSYGKGIVQTMYQFPTDGAGMQLTTSAYYTAGGKSIHHTGVSPDIEAALGEDGVDNQLNTALEYLWKEIGYEHVGQSED